MNPNVRLEELRAKVATLLMHHSLSEEEMIDTGIDIADLFSGLDEWISCGGELPLAWKQSL